MPTRRRTRTRSSRAYRSYRRRYYRYARRSRIPKAIGTSQKNYVSCCFTVTQQGAITFNVGRNFQHTYLFFSPFASRFLVPFQLSSQDSWAGVFGLYNSFAFRKYLTMYNQLKINGVYLSLTISPKPEFSDNGYNVYFVWDRQTTVQQAAKYDAYHGNPNEIRQNAMDQGIQPKRIFPGKGRVSARTKCVASSAMERTGWIDTTTYYRENYITVNDVIYATNDFQIQYWRDNPTLNAFSPGCWCNIESLDYNNYVTATQIPIEVTMKIYCDFRNPGNTFDTNEITELLLKENKYLWARPYEPDETTKKLPLDPSLIPDTEAKKRKREDDTDMCAQPATKAVEHEELPDEEEPSTQLL